MERKRIGRVAALAALLTIVACGQESSTGPGAGNRADVAGLRIRGEYRSNSGYDYVRIDHVLLEPAP